MSDEKAPKGEAAPAAPQREMSIEEEERAMHTGGWKLPVLLGLMAVLILGGIALFIMSGSQKEEIDEAAGHLNRMHTEHFVAFYGCAKIPHEVRFYKSRDDMTGRMAKIAWGSEKRYGAYLKSKCIPQFGDYGSQVAAMDTPEGMRAEVQDLAAKIRNLRSAWDEYIRYLDRTEPEEPEDAIVEHASPVANAFSEYFVSRNKLVKAVNKLRGED
jgi:hypothetical protein